MTYAFWRVVWDEVPCALHKHVRPVALLAHNPGHVPVIVVPRGVRLPREALDATKGCVLHVRSYTLALRLNRIGVHGLSLRTWMTTGMI